MITSLSFIINKTGYGQMDQQTSFYHYSCALAVKMRYITYIIRGARKRGVERFWALYCPEALGIGSSVALEDKEANALRNLARLTSLIDTTWKLHVVR